MQAHLKGIRPTLCIQNQDRTNSQAQPINDDIDDTETLDQVDSPRLTACVRAP